MRISYWSSDLCSSDLLCQVGKLALIGAEDRRVELELLGGIGDPASAEALPRPRRDRTGAEHRPHRHFTGAGVAARNEAEAVGGGPCGISCIRSMQWVRRSLPNFVPCERPPQSVALLEASHQGGVAGRRSVCRRSEG